MESWTSRLFIKSYFHSLLLTVIIIIIIIVIRFCFCFCHFLTFIQTLWTTVYCSETTNVSFMY